MQVFDPSRAYNAFTAGAQLGGAMRQRETERMAAPAISAGNYGQAAEIYGQRGDVAGAAGYRQMYEQQLAQMDEQQKAEARNSTESIARLGFVLRGINTTTETGQTVEDLQGRFATLQRNAPFLNAMGIPLDDITPDTLTNQNLDMIMAQVMELDQLLKAQQPSGPYTLAPGARRYDAMGNLIAENPREIPEQRLTPYQEQSLAIQRDRMAMEQRRAEEAAARTSTRPLIGSESMGRVAAGLPNMRKAVSDLYSLFGTGYTPGQDWGALALEMLPGIGDVAARLAGGQDYQTFDLAYSQFEAAALPIMSGAAVTESEAKRALRALRVRIGDSQETINAKMANMSRMVQGLEAAAAGDTEALRQIVGGIASQEGQGAAPMQGEMEDNGLPPGFVIIE